MQFATSRKELTTSIAVLFAIAILTLGTVAFANNRDSADDLAAVDSAATTSTTTTTDDSDNRGSNSGKGSSGDDDEDDEDAVATTPGTTSPMPTPATPTPTPSATTSPYKDGTYTATGKYQTPDGTESLPVTLTISNGSISSSTVTVGARDRTSKQYQAEFIANYKPSVVGKAISSLSLSRISGSSLTPKGFNDALAKIKAQAQI